MMSSDVVISLINSLRKNDKQAIDRSIRKLIEAAEKRKQHKLAKKLREAYASTAESQHPTSFYPSSVTPESAEENQNLFEIRRSKTNLSQIILSETNKETLLEIINNYNKRELLKKHGLTNASRIILSGPPGTGKTLSAYVLAGELKIPIYHVYLDSLISSYLGETGKNLKTIFEEASKEECVLLLDEFDAIAKHRDDTQELGELKRVVTVLLQNIDELNPHTMLIAATNHEHLLDPAVWRRFDYSIRMEALDLPLRKSLILMNLSEKRHISIDLLAELSEGLSGAIIKQVINRALRKTILNENDSNLESLLVEGFLSANVIKNSRLKDGQRKIVVKAIKYLRKFDRPKYTYEKLEKITGIPSSTLHYLDK